VHEAEFVAVFVHQTSRNGVWEAVMTLVYAVAGFAFALWFGLFLRALIDSRLTLHTGADSIAFVPTSDGAKLAISRYVPATQRPDECPVVLCHGFGANRFNFDFDEQLSMARYLRGRGYDVFVMEMRGTGLSSDPNKDGPSFREVVELDLPAAIGHVLLVTGAEKVNWVGHSLGGTVMYAALGGPLAAKVNTLTALAAPANFESQKFLRRLAFAYPMARPLLKRSGTGLARAVAAFAGSWVPGFSALANLSNMESRTIRRVLWSVSERNSVRMIDDFVGWLRKRSGPTYGELTQEQHWAKIKIPLLLAAGAKDWAPAPTASVRYAFYHAASTEKEFVILSKASGFRADYGHGDLVVGRHAAEEVFPLVEKFLWAHRQASAEAETGNERLVS